jgi:hypothetical protein
MLALRHYASNSRAFGFEILATASTQEYDWRCDADIQNAWRQKKSDARMQLCLQISYLYVLPLCLAYSSILKMEAIFSSEKSLNYTRDQ